MSKFDWISSTIPNMVKQLSKAARDKNYSRLANRYSAIVSSGLREESDNVFKARFESLMVMKKVNSQVKIVSRTTGRIDRSLAELMSISSSFVSGHAVYDNFDNGDVIARRFNILYDMIDISVRRFSNMHFRDRVAPRSLINKYDMRLIESSEMKEAIIANAIRVVEIPYLQAAHKRYLKLMYSGMLVDDSIHKIVLKILSDYARRLFRVSSESSNFRKNEIDGLMVTTDSILQDTLDVTKSKDGSIQVLDEAADILDISSMMACILAMFVPPQAKVSLMLISEITSCTSMALNVSSDVLSILDPEDVQNSLDDFVNSKSDAYFQGASATIDVQGMDKGSTVTWGNISRSRRPYRYL